MAAGHLHDPCQYCGEINWHYHHGVKSFCDSCKNPAPKYQFTVEEHKIFEQGLAALQQNHWLNANLIFQRYVDRFPKSPYGIIRKLLTQNFIKIE